ncbi:MAG: type II toxin-antitoxin system VapC family toxin [Candidatus Verstraetearchaeota archaeon]|nr:type II toxin-antitoxin system VapC family toxin [Candidatus Verstraetearchaeota archaeon]
MLEKPWYPTRAVIDVNIPAIYLVEDHPGHLYISSYFDELISKASTVYAHSVTPFRVLWLLTRRWGFKRAEAVEILRDFVERMPIEYVGLSKKWISRSFELAEELHHDVYDCSYIALALMVKAEAIISTDEDFRKLAPRACLKFINPVPLEILKKFKYFKKLS